MYTGYGALLHGGVCAGARAWLCAHVPRAWGWASWWSAKGWCTGAPRVEHSLSALASSCDPMHDGGVPSVVPLWYGVSAVCNACYLVYLLHWLLPLTMVLHVCGMYAVSGVVGQGGTGLKLVHDV